MHSTDSAWSIPTSHGQQKFFPPCNNTRIIIFAEACILLRRDVPELLQSILTQKLSLHQLSSVHFQILLISCVCRGIGACLVASKPNLSDRNCGSMKQCCTKWQTRMWLSQKTLTSWWWTINPMVFTGSLVHTSRLDVSILMWAVSWIFHLEKVGQAHITVPLILRISTHCYALNIDWFTLLNIAYYKY